MKIKILLVLIVYVFGKHLCCAMDKQISPKFEFHYGYSARQGLRPTMEDAHVVLSKFSEDRAFFGVYDGHGGVQVAHFAARNLHFYVHENLMSEPQKSRDEILKTAFARTEQNIIDKKLDSGSTAVVSLLDEIIQEGGDAACN